MYYTPLHCYSIKSWENSYKNVFTSRVENVAISDKPADLTLHGFQNRL